MRREEEVRRREEGGEKKGPRGWKKGWGGESHSLDCVKLGLLLGRRAWE